MKFVWFLDFSCSANSNSPRKQISAKCISFISTKFTDLIPIECFVLNVAQSENGIFWWKHGWHIVDLDLSSFYMSFTSPKRTFQANKCVGRDTNKIQKGNTNTNILCIPSHSNLKEELLVQKNSKNNQPWQRK